MTSLEKMRGCGILVVPPKLGPINNFQVPNFFSRNIIPREQLISMYLICESKILHHIVLPILLVDFVHLDCHLLVFIYSKDSSNLTHYSFDPLVVLITHLGEVLFKHFFVFLKLNDLV
jgi:hypothetical protein